jgi:hypothetical protein
MPRCYLLAVARGSALNADTNNFTLFELVEGISAHTRDSRIHLPLELHTYWEFAADELNVDFEMRFVSIGAPASG